MMKEDVINRPRGREAVRLFIARVDGIIVGWTSVILPHPRVCIPVKPDARVVPLYTYVKYAYRRQGIGRGLLSRASKFARSLNYSPTVYGWNRASMKFFEDSQDTGIHIRDWR